MIRPNSLEQKWPNSITLIRHGETHANLDQVTEVEGYAEFKKQFHSEYDNLTPFQVAKRLFPSPKLRAMAEDILEKWHPKVGDYETALTDKGWDQARKTGKGMAAGKIEVPSMVYVSPYKRTLDTLAGMIEGWPELKEAMVLEDDRIREKEMGKLSVYGNWRLYDVFNPEYAMLYKMSSRYEFRSEGGESTLDVRGRTRGFISTVIREHGGLQLPENKPENIVVVTHSMTILALRANFERWSREKFFYEDENNFPHNCGLTVYRGKVATGNSRRGQKGRLVLDENNIKLY
jgi:broad specificity phosphatase PhoE